MTTALQLLLCALTLPASAAILDKQAQLDAQTFWDNRDWDWYKANIPFFECPDADITTTYYYRWELITKHLTYGSPDQRLFLHRVHRPAVLVGRVWRHQLPGRPSALRGALAARSALCPGLQPLLAAHARRPAAQLQHLAGGLGLGGPPGASATTPSPRTCLPT